MLKNKNVLLFTLVVFCSSFVQADWHDTLRWLQNNAKRHVTAKKVAAVVGIAALCAVGIGCWWKLSNKDTRYVFAYHKNTKKEDGYSEYEIEQVPGYVFFALYYTDCDKDALDTLMQNKPSARTVIEEFSRAPVDAKKVFFETLLDNMNLKIRNKHNNAALSVGMVLVDEQNNYVYAANIGDIIISNNRIKEYLQGATDKHLGQELNVDDKQVQAVKIANGLRGELVIEKRQRKLPEQKTIGFSSPETIGFTTKTNDPDMADVVNLKDVALAVKWQK